MPRCLGEPELVHIKGAEAPGARDVGCWPSADASHPVGQRADPGRTHLGDSTPSPASSMRRSAAPGVWSGDRGAAGYRQEPHGPRSRGAGHRPRRRGVHRLLRIPHPRRPVPCGGATVARRSSGSTVSTTWRPAAQVRARVPDADPEDLLLLDDLLGIGDPEAALPAITADARRRRLTALVNAAVAGATAPALYVIEDVHWIDEVSESHAGRLPDCGPADAVAGADHLPPRIPRRAVADHRARRRSRLRR